MNEPTLQQEFQAGGAAGSGTQCQRLLVAFHEAGEGTWVPMPMLARAMSPSDNGAGNCPPRRIYDLRKQIEKDGFTIENRKEWKDGICHSFYRIIRVHPCPSVVDPNPNAHSSP
jgi:hypothetical protein